MSKGNEEGNRIPPKEQNSFSELNLDPKEIYEMPKIELKMIVKKSQCGTWE